ncbi:MAG: hypothetical protein ACK43N_09645 [Pirellulaceae bacterium]
MRPKRNLFEIDYLVFSSYKSATQTVSHSLRSNGIPAFHCHSLENRNIELSPGNLADFLADYRSHNDRPLNIVTIFREPLQRYISAFFQWHGQGVIRNKLIGDIADTLIYQKTAKELQEIFLKEVHDEKLIGQGESIDLICKELGLSIDQLNYREASHLGILELPDCRLFSLRFDQLFEANHFESILSQITGRPFSMHQWNIGATKWYADRYADFKATLAIPEPTIRKIYHSKQAILDHFYPGQFDRLLSEAITQYQPKRY